MKSFKIENYRPVSPNSSLFMIATGGINPTPKEHWLGEGLPPLQDTKLKVDRHSSKTVLTLKAFLPIRSDNFQPKKIFENILILNGPRLKPENRLSL